MAMDEVPVIEETNYTTPTETKRQYYIGVFSLSGINPMKENSTEFEIYTSVSDVNSTDESFTEDLKYQYLDALESHLRNEMPATIKYEIQSRELFVFDTYKQASIKRTEILEADNLTSEVNSELSDKYKDEALTLLIENRDFPMALNLVDKAIESNPRNSVAYYVKGNILHKQGNRIGAISQFKKAIDINPNDPSYYAKTAICYGQLKDMPNFCFYAYKACNLGEPDACNMKLKFCK